MNMIKMYTLRTKAEEYSLHRINDNLEDYITVKMVHGDELCEDEIQNISRNTFENVISVCSFIDKDGVMVIFPIRFKGEKDIHNRCISKLVDDDVDVALHVIKAGPQLDIDVIVNKHRSKFKN